MADSKLSAPPNPGQWIKLASETPGLRDAGGLLVGVWYPPGKRFAGWPAPAAFATFWPMAADGMPTGGHVDVTGLDLFACPFADVPPSRSRSMTPDEIARFVDGVKNV